MARRYFSATETKQVIVSAMKRLRQQVLTLGGTFPSQGWLHPRLRAHCFLCSQQAVMEPPKKAPSSVAHTQVVTSIQLCYRSKSRFKYAAKWERSVSSPQRLTERPKWSRPELKSPWLRLTFCMDAESCAVWGSMHVCDPVCISNYQCVSTEECASINIYISVCVSSC